MMDNKHVQRRMVSRENQLNRSIDKKSKDIHYGCKRSLSNEHAYNSLSAKGILSCIHCGFKAKVKGR
jgi:hypothetical protein